MGVCGRHPFRRASRSRGIHNADKIAVLRRRLKISVCVTEQIFKSCYPAGLRKPGWKSAGRIKIPIFVVEDHAIQVLKIIRNVLQPLHILVVDNNLFCSRIITNSCQDTLAIGEVDRHFDGTALSQAAPQGHIVDGVRQHHQNRLLVFNAERCRTPCELIRTQVHVAVTDTVSRRRLNEILVGEPICLPGQDLSDRTLF